MEIRNVESVLEHGKLCLGPGSPDYIRDLLKPRGEAVPVVDVRRKLGLPEAGQEGGGELIVLALEKEGRKHLIGALVDEVCEGMHGYKESSSQ